MLAPSCGLFWDLVSKNTTLVPSMHEYLVMSSYFVTLWIIGLRALLSMEFSRQEYWSELPFPSPGDPPAPGIEPMSPVSPVLAGGFFTTAPPGNPHNPSVQFSSVHFSLSVVSDSLRPHESQHARPPCPLPIPRVHTNSCPSSQ